MLLLVLLAMLLPPLVYEPVAQVHGTLLHPTRSHTVCNCMQLLANLVTALQPPYEFIDHCQHQFSTPQLTTSKHLHPSTSETLHQTATLGNPCHPVTITPAAAVSAPGSSRSSSSSCSSNSKNNWKC